MKKISTAMVYLFIILMAMITLFPFIYMILSSGMTFQEATSIPPTLFPKTYLFSNFALALKQAPFAQYFVNTVFVSLSTTAGVLITSVLAGFALSTLEFKFKNVISLLLISLLMIPFEVTVFTNFNTIAKMGLLDTYTALIIPFLASVFYIFYLQEYFTGIPISFYKAAKVDGCSDLTYIRKILIPMSRPALVTVGILNFIGSWNSFLWPLLVTNTPSLRLLNNGLSAFASESGTAVQLQMAASTFTIIPILIIYFIFRKRIIEGVARNGLKG